MKASSPPADAPTPLTIGNGGDDVECGLTSRLRRFLFILYPRVDHARPGVEAQ